MAANSQHRCVFVGNIPYDATEEQLVQICEEVGPVVSFRLVIDRETGKPKGYGFCEYKDEETALSARRNLQGYEINGRQLRVDFAENDKGSDRNREQGRGGPGFTASNDAQRPLGGPAILADPAFNQPIGIPLAATAASVLVGALGGVQADSISAKQNGLQSQSGFGNDPLTHSLANMSRKQLYDVLSEMKVMSTQNKELARQLLLVSPQLTKALFQAQIMLGMVTPQMLQNPNLRQSSSLLLQPLAQDTIHDPKPTVLPPHPGPKSFTQNKTQFGLIPRVTEGQVSSVPHSFNNNHPPAFPFQQVQMQPRFQHPQQAHNPLLPPTTMPVLSGASTVPSLRPFTGLSTRPQTSMLENSVASKQNMQTLQSQNPRPVHNTQSALPNAASHQHSLLPRPPLSQPTFQLGSSSSTSFLGVPETANKLTQKSAQGTDGTIWPPSSNAYSNLPFGLSEQTGLVSGPSEPTYYPSKLPRLENGRGALHTTSQNITSISGSTSSPILGSSSLPGDRNFTNEAEQHSDNQFSEMQLAPEVQSALLKQVMSLTSEQLSSLPPEQQQQVLQLQQMLR